MGSTILQNRLDKTLPPAFDALFPSGVQIAYAAIPAIGALEEPLRGEVREAFARSLRVVWLTMVGMSGAGLLSVVLMREVPMQRMTDETYGLDAGEKSVQPELRDAEKRGGVAVEEGSAVRRPELGSEQ